MTLSGLLMAAPTTARTGPLTAFTGTVTTIEVGVTSDACVVSGGHGPQSVKATRLLAGIAASKPTPSTVTSARAGARSGRTPVTAMVGRVSVRKRAL